MNVQFSGMELDGEQTDIVKSHSDRFCKGCEAENLHINIKQHRKAGDRFSYTTQVRADTGDGIKSAEFTDWEFGKCVKEAFRKLEKEIK
jgi:hypothetical protein